MIRDRLGRDMDFGIVELLAGMMVRGFRHGFDCDHHRRHHRHHQHHDCVARR
jgi:hypothetical protein